MYIRCGSRILIGLGVALLALTGCSDANAATSTYLPVDQSCPFEDGIEATTTLEFPDPSWDLEDDGDDDEEVDGDDETSLLLGDQDEPETMGPAAEPKLLVNINRAKANELTELPGIGPALADRIIEYRKHRRFEEPAHLLRVQGIGPATMERIGPHIRVE